MKNHGTKSEIVLDQKLVTKTIMMENVLKSKLIQVIVSPNRRY